MVAGTRLEQTLKTTQQMIMSPQMQQAIQILQMPIMDLRLRVAEEMAANPMLEENADMIESPDEPIPDNETEYGDPYSRDESFDAQFEKIAHLDDEWRDFFKQSYSINRSSAQDEEKRRFFESSITICESLQEHLLSQLNLLTLPPQQEKIAEHLIGSLDENGYFRTPVAGVAESLKVPEDEVELALFKIQQFTPLGVGARDLRECLLIQIRNLEDTHNIIHQVVDQHLEDLARNKYPQIAKSLKTSVEQIQRAAQIISTLEPKPGRAFSTGNNNYIIPDIFIEEKEDGFQVYLNDDRIPHLRISDNYRKVIRDESAPEEDKAYIRNKIKSGMWFIKNIHQRQETIYRIMNEIILIQEGFLKNGVAYLKPITMQDIASRLGIHESTVSRAVGKKHVQTPQGLFPVKYFFSQEMKSSSGESTSTRNLKQRIHDLIKAEDPRHPLSDQDIITLLGQEGLELARRTVSKYRKELKIPPSHIRRQF